MLSLSTSISRCGENCPTQQTCSPLLACAGAEHDSGGCWTRVLWVSLIFGLHALQWCRCSVVSVFSVRYLGKCSFAFLQFLLVWLDRRMHNMGCQLQKEKYTVSLAWWFKCAAHYLRMMNTKVVSPYITGCHIGFFLTLFPFSWLVFTRASTLALWAWMTWILLFPPGICTAKWRPKNSPFSVFSAFLLI